MCLSTVYFEDGGERKKLAEQVGGIAVDGEKVTLTDLLGEETVVEGEIVKVDLLENYIVLRGAGAGTGA